MLRQIRILAALALGVLFSLVFLVDGFASSFLGKTLLASQFTPSLLKALTSGSIYTLGFIFVVVLTLLFGRLYCACLCPLGILQDLIAYLKRELSTRQVYSYHEGYRNIRYAVLLITIFSVAAGSLAVLNLFDPFSQFGRILVSFAAPLLAAAKNALVSLSEYFEFYAVWPEPFRFPPAQVLLLTMLLFAVLLLLTIHRGRLYCNTLCPVGTLLGVISRFSLIRISNNEQACNSCGVCQRVCPAECISTIDKKIDSSRCISCFDCLEVCPGNALSFQPQWQKPSSPTEDSRRTFLTSSAAAVALALASLPLRSLTKPPIAEGENEIIIPPGARSISHFTEACTACSLCVTSCPSGIIRPSLFSFGLAGMLQPKINFKFGHCEFECTICGEVCPTGAIGQLPINKKTRVQIGQVHFKEDLCVVETEKKDCGACAEVCPTRAVHMELRGDLFFPATEVEQCIGCGHCQFVCPTDPKAIIVRGIPVHRTAKLAPEEEVKPTTERTEETEFPF